METYQYTIKSNLMTVALDVAQMCNTTKS